MNRVIEGTLYHLAGWPLGLAIVSCAVAGLLLVRARRSAAQASEPAQRYSPRGWFFVQLLATLLLMANMLAGFLTFAIWPNHDAPSSFLTAFIWLVPPGIVLSIVGAVMAMMAPRRSANQSIADDKPWRRAAAGLVGAGFALLHVWSIFDTDRFPQVDLHGCSMIQTGVDCPFEVAQAAPRWQIKGQPHFRFDKAGTYSAQVRLQHGAAEIEKTISVSVGDDRGSPLFAPRVGDEWHFEYVRHGSTHVFIVGSSHSESSGIGTLTMRATGERVFQGRRWIRLEIDTKREDDEASKQKATKTDFVWVFFHNGQTYNMPGGREQPAWMRFDALELAVYRPGIDPAPPAPEGGKKRRAPEIPDPYSPIAEHSVGCEFRVLGLGCRCAERGLGKDRTLPGPAFCSVDSDRLAGVAIMLLTVFAAFPDYSTDLWLISSQSTKGLPPPQPPLVEIESQEHYHQRQLDEHRQREDAKDAARKAHQKEVFAAYQASIIEMFDKGHPALTSCAAVGTKKRTGRGQLYLCITDDGIANIARIDYARPYLYNFELCVRKALTTTRFPPNPVLGECAKIDIKY